MDLQLIVRKKSHCGAFFFVVPKAATGSYFFNKKTLFSPLGNPLSIIMEERKV
ncbi:hypothetical protein D931_02095 [Enterococcus faecium 13.SD.W.09]|nr:hypothetical protein D931_02095 [Enterococcus faecium 13.SD.W.09]